MSDMHNIPAEGIFSPHNNKPNPEKTDNDRFSKLNQKAEEMKKINLFYLKDVLIKPNISFEEKL